MSRDLIIKPQSGNTLVIELGDIQLFVYASSDYISIRSKNKGKIEYPELMGFGDNVVESKDSVRFS